MLQSANANTFVLATTRRIRFANSWTPRLGMRSSIGGLCEPRPRYDPLRPGGLCCLGVLSQAKRILDWEPRFRFSRARPPYGRNSDLELFSVRTPAHQHLGKRP